MENRAANLIPRLLFLELKCFMSSCVFCRIPSSHCDSSLLYFMLAC